MKFKYILLSYFLILTIPVLGQETLSLSDALENTLKNNYFIKITRNDNQIVKNDNTPGNAGFLPSVDLAAGINKTTSTTKQEYNNGTTDEGQNVSTDNLNASVKLNWTLFDGMRMFATRSRLGLSEEASDINLKIQIENTVADVIRNYFNIVRIQQEIKVLEETIKINDDRIKIADKRFEIGSASKLEMLQAKVDRNEQFSQILLLRKELIDAFATMNLLMGKSEYSEFLVSDSITITYQPKYEDLHKSVMSNNKEILSYQKNSEINKMLIRESRADRMPKLDFDIYYNYSKITNEVGFSLLNENRGLNTGLSLTWNIFDGFNTSRKISNAKINFQSAELLLSDTRSKLEQNVYKAYQHFQSDLEILQLETTNMSFARENVNVALEAYRVGTISGLQLKEAQNSYESSYSRLVEARYNAKISETELMRLNGDLVK